MIDPKAPAMLTPEPTGGVVWHASRGAITLRVTVSGREAHVGQAHLVPCPARRARTRLTLIPMV